MENNTIKYININKDDIVSLKFPNVNIFEIWIYLSYHLTQFKQDDNYCHINAFINYFILDNFQYICLVKLDTDYIKYIFMQNNDNNRNVIKKDIEFLKKQLIREVYENYHEKEKWVITLEDKIELQEAKNRELKSIYDYGKIKK